jgi:hypothetical protein
LIWHAIVCMQGGGGGVQKFRASKGAALHGGKPPSRFRRFKRRRARLCMHLCFLASPSCHSVERLAGDVHAGVTRGWTPLQRLSISVLSSWKDGEFLGGC